MEYKFEYCKQTSTFHMAVFDRGNFIAEASAYCPNGRIERSQFFTHSSRSLGNVIYPNMVSRFNSVLLNFLVGDRPNFVKISQYQPNALDFACCDELPF